MEQNNQKKKNHKSGSFKRKKYNKKRLNEIASKSKKLKIFFPQTILSQNFTEQQINQNPESKVIDCISEKLVPNSPLKSQVHITSNIDSTHCFNSPSTSISTDLNISTDSRNKIPENCKQTELLSQQIPPLSTTTLSKYSEREPSKTFEHYDLPHIDIVDQINFNYFIKPSGKQNIQRFFSFHPNHPEKKNDGTQLPFNTSKAYYVEISGSQKKIKINWLTFSYEQNSFFCSICLVYSSKKSVFTSVEGFVDWVHVYERIRSRRVKKPQRSIKMLYE